MTDYRKILMLRSMGCSQREMERNKIASRETSKAVFETADRLGICWPLDDDIANADLERLLFPNKYKNACLYVEPDHQYIYRELDKPGVGAFRSCTVCLQLPKSPESVPVQLRYKRPHFFHKLQRQSGFKCSLPHRQEVLPL